jgi:hypothetical protein
MPSYFTVIKIRLLLLLWWKYSNLPPQRERVREYLENFDNQDENENFPHWISFLMVSTINNNSQTFSQHIEVY